MEQQPTSPAPVSAPAIRPPMDDVMTMVQAAWRWFFAHLRKLLGISAVMVVGQIIVGIIVVAILAGLGLNADNVSGGVIASTFFAMVALAILLGLLSVWMTVAIYVYITGNDPSMSIKRAYQLGSQLTIPYFSTSLLFGLYVLLGFFLLIVPGIYWAILYGLAPLIIVVEGRNVRAMARSKELVKGYWGAVFVRMLVLNISVYIATFIINIVFSALDKSLQSVFPTLGVITNLGQYFSSLFVAPVSLIFTFLVYQNLKRLKG